MHRSFACWQDSLVACAKAFLSRCKRYTCAAAVSAPKCMRSIGREPPGFSKLHLRSHTVANLRLINSSPSHHKMLWLCKCAGTPFTCWCVSNSQDCPPAYPLRGVWRLMTPVDRAHGRRQRRSTLCKKAAEESSYRTQRPRNERRRTYDPTRLDVPTAAIGPRGENVSW